MAGNDCGNKFNGIASKLFFKKLTDFNLTKWQHMAISHVQKISINGCNFIVDVEIVKLSN